MSKAKENRFFTPEMLHELCTKVRWDQNDQRIDSLNASVLAAQVLEDVQSKAVDYLYPQLKARQLIPRGEGAAAGASHVVWHEHDHAGMAEVISNYGDDIPEVVVEAAEQTSPIKTIATAYSYSTSDLRRVVFARANGRQASLNVNKAQVADEYIERKIDSIAVKGDSATGLPGLCRNGNVTTLSAAAAAAGANAPEWDGADKVAQEIYDDVVNLISTMNTTSKGVHKANVVAAPVAQYNVLKTTLFLTSTANSMTILEALNKHFPEVSFVEWAALEEGGTGDIELVVAMDTGELNLELVVPMEAMTHPPQANNLSWKVPVEAETGGCIIKRPLAVLYMDSI